MKLLILTQKIDINDDVLGFMHGWVAEFARHCDKITVIALGVGEYNLPDNVRVLSLGKERSAKKISYVLNFYQSIWRERKNYDVVFVHMNKEYVVLGGLIWKMLNKKIVMWYNHAKGDYLSKLSGWLADTICYTSPFSFFAKYKKAKIMPIGVDTELFKPEMVIKKIRNSLLFLGRISPVKNLETLVGAAKIVKESIDDFKLNIIGSPTPGAQEYYKSLLTLRKKFELENNLSFPGNLANNKTPSAYNRHEIFINLTDSGSMDKTTFEAMACGDLVLVSNQSFKAIFPSAWHKILLFKENDPADLARKIISLMRMDLAEKDRLKSQLSRIAAEEHSLKKLAEEIFKIIN